MKLFEERFDLFFNDLVLQKYIDDCLAKSIKALKVKNGNTPKWNEALNELNALSKGHLGLNEPYLSINNIEAPSEIIESKLLKLLPWRKGPFTLNDLTLESEWQGDMKWQRLKNDITPLKNRRVLDVGAGNGYFTLRMALEGAKKALGIEPFLLFNYQYAAINALYIGKIQTQCCFH